MNQLRHFSRVIVRVSLMAGLSGFTAVMATGCTGGVYREAQAVVVTGVPAKVAHCHAVGTVQDDRGGDSFDDRMLALKEAAIVRSANTVLVSSPALSRDGIAYICQPPVKPDGAP